WPVLVDEYLILNVLHGVLENAMEAMDWSGPIEVTARNQSVKETLPGLPLEPGDYVCLAIRDHGPGIPAKILPRVFEPYFTTRGDGRGVGLSNAISILKQHGGWISLRSGDTGGVTATIYLPAQPQAEAAAAKQPNKVVQGTGRVLLMDDDL